MYSIDEEETKERKMKGRVSVMTGSRNMWGEAERLNLFRQEIMGIAAILIVVGHSQDFIVGCTPQLARMIGYGSVGINIFAFLSGIGLHHSMDKCQSVIHFYHRRICRVFLPYILITAVMTIPTIFFQSGGVKQYLLDLLCISFWTQHRGAWYIAWLLPICIVYPFIWRCEKSSRRNYFASVVSILVSTFLAYLGESNTFLHEFRSVYSVTISFFLGNMYTTHVQSNKRTLWILLLGFIPTPFYALGVIKNDVFYVWTFALFGIGLCALFALILSLINRINRVKWGLDKMGAVSLESYLTNIYLITLARRLFKGRIETGLGPVIYIGIVIVGLFLAMMINNEINRRVCN